MRQQARISAFAVSKTAVKLVPAFRARNWMDQTRQGYANRCLPMKIANQLGWMILNDKPLKAKWLGQTNPDSVVIECEGGAPALAVSHFGEGVLTFLIPYIFRTPPGVSLLFRGPPNMPKDAIAPLEAIVESDWAVSGLSMNWKFTRPETWVNFGKDEPICMMLPYSIDLLESLAADVSNLTHDPDLEVKYRAWRSSCDSFSQKLRSGDPHALKEGWQKFYFRGTAPHAGSAPILEAAQHRTKIVVADFISSADEC